MKGVPVGPASLKDRFFSKAEDFKDLRVTVMGLGVFGGGADLTRFLVDRGARVTVTDLRGEKDLFKSLARLKDLPVRLVLGEHREEDFRDTDCVVVNPAVPSRSPYLALCRDEGIPVETEMNLTLRFLPTRHVIGVTGSNGKTTTAHLVFEMLAASGKKAWLGGNMGGSLLPALSGIGEEDRVVLELSSFQLERLDRRGPGPRIGVITNLSPNHLDRHGDFESYVEAKARIFEFAEAAVLNSEDATSMARFRDLKIPVTNFSSLRELEQGFFLRDGNVVERTKDGERVLVPHGAVRLPGDFNKENFMAALAAVRLAAESGGISAEMLQAGLSFGGVPHRLEAVASKNGVRYINDSISTTPVSCMAGLDAIGGEIHLILGGYDKGLPFDDLVAAVLKKTRTVLLVGDTGPRLGEAIQRAAEEQGIAPPDLCMARTLIRAVEEAARKAMPGSTVLLSPGFASYDQFLNFVERGECFRHLVAAL